MSDEKSPPPKPPAATQCPIKVNRLWRRFARWIEHTLAVIGAALVLLVITPATTWLYDALDREVPLARADHIICLGGDSSRVIEAARLLREGYAPDMIVSNHPPFAEEMKDLAVDWGVAADQILVDDGAFKTRDHPRSIAKITGVDPKNDRIIIVTSYTHLARAKSCFEKAGYRNLIMRQPRWERDRASVTRDWKWRWRVLADVVYEYAAWAEYTVRGDV